MDKRDSCGGCLLWLMLGALAWLAVMVAIFRGVI